MFGMWKTISPKETFQHAENFEEVCAWETDLRTDRTATGTQQAMGPAADGSRSSTATAD